MRTTRRGGVSSVAGATSGASRTNGATGGMPLGGGGAKADASSSRLMRRVEVKSPPASSGSAAEVSNEGVARVGISAVGASAGGLSRWRLPSAAVRR